MAKVAPRTVPLARIPVARTPDTPCRYNPPLRKWERGTVTADGTQLWFSREWLPGEAQEYARTVLKQT